MSLVLLRKLMHVELRHFEVFNHRRGRRVGVFPAAVERSSIRQRPLSYLGVIVVVLLVDIGRSRRDL
jgi:hypothetical protein